MVTVGAVDVPVVSTPPAIIRQGVDGRATMQRFGAGTFTLASMTGAADDPTGGSSVRVAASAPTAIEPASAAPAYEATTTFIVDRDDLARSAVGSVTTQPRPQDDRHSIAHPAGMIRIDPDRVERPTPPGTGWREIPGTRLVDVMTPSVGGGYLRAALQNWTGWGWSEPLRLAAGYEGGGHNGNNNATWIGFDEKALRPLQFYPPSPLRGIGAGGSAGDRMPGPEYQQTVHWYGSQVGIVDPRDGRPKFMNVSHVAQTGSIFDPMAGTIEKTAPYLLHRQLTKSDTDLGEDMTGLTAVFDPKRGIYLMHTRGRANQLSHFEPARNRWFGHGDVDSWGGYWGPTGSPHTGQSGENAGYVVVRIDPKRDRIVAMSKESGVGLLPLSWLAGRPDQAGGPPLADIEWGHAGFETPTVLSTRATFDYDPDHDDFVIYDVDPAKPTQGIVYRMDPVAFTITELARGGPAPNENGTWGRFWYSAARKEWFTVADIDANFWSFRR